VWTSTCLQKYNRSVDLVEKTTSTRLVASRPAWLTCERGITKLKTLTKLSNGTKNDSIGWAYKGHLRGGGEEVRDVLLSGAVVGVAVCDMPKNPSFVHRKPVFKFDWIWFSRQMLIQRWGKPQGANELRALVSEII
jgi:hypothetical protein